MMTPEQAFEAATGLLAQRGQLMNAHLFRLVEGDQELYRLVRERLILEGLAEDRSGVGLAWTNSSIASASTDHETPKPDLSETDRSLEADWWLMASGVVRGPLELVTLCQMLQQSEVQPADVVRHGGKGLWQRPADIPMLAAVKPFQSEPDRSADINERRRVAWRASSKVEARESRLMLNSTSSETTRLSADVESRRSSVDENRQNVSGKRMGDSGDLSESPSDLQRSSNNLSDIEKGGGAALDQEDVAAKNRFVMPEKTWSLGKQARPGWLARGWHVAAGMVGGSKRLLGILLSVAAIGLVYYWWQQPPPASTVYREFTTCRAVLKKLQDKRVSKSEWELMADRYRPRINAIVARLKSRASSRYPVENSLFLAGRDGLLPMFDNPVVLSGPEIVFEKHMEAANKLLNGGKSQSPP